MSKSLNDEFAEAKKQIEELTKGIGATEAQPQLWYYTTDPDGVWHGKCSSREEAIEAGRDEYPGEDYFVAWAINDPIRLADWIDIEGILERADDALADSDRVSFEYDEQPVFEATPEQQRDLFARVQRACDEWQAAHKLVFTVSTFSRMGEPELIRADDEASP
jgi:hypothetical protein